MKYILGTLLAIFCATASYDAFAGPEHNHVHIDQVGDNLELTILQKGKDLIFFVYGPIIKEAIKAAYILKERFNFSSTIISCKSLEPFDFSKLNKINRYKLVLTLEEHVNVGGLSEIINNFLLNKKNIGKVINFNIKKNFFHKIGSQEYLRKSAKIDSYNIVKKIKENINVK